MCENPRQVVCDFDSKEPNTVHLFHLGPTDSMGVVFSSFCQFISFANTVDSQYELFLLLVIHQKMMVSSAYFTILE